MSHGWLGTAGNDTLTGSAEPALDANNVIAGLGGNDVLYGLSGSDTIYGDRFPTGDIADDGRPRGIPGNDSLYGGDGFDKLYGDEGNDLLDGGSNDDSLYGGSGNDRLYGGSGNDILDGGDRNQLASYQSGDDTMYGGSGNDTYYVDSIGDVIIEYANEGTDTVVSSVTYTLGENQENLTLQSSFFYSLNGYGNALNNRILGNSDGNHLYGYEGNDYLDGSFGDDYINGGGGNDSLYGGNSNDTLLGMSGNDALYGGEGNDRLDGYATTGTEYDTLSGGAGDDTFVLGGSWGVSYQGNGFAEITDFNGAYDQLEVVGSSSSYSFGYANWRGGSATDTAIYFGGQSTFQNVIAIVYDTTITNFNDFVFV